MPLGVLASTSVVHPTNIRSALAPCQGTALASRLVMGTKSSYVFEKLDVQHGRKTSIEEMQNGVQNYTEISPAKERYRLAPVGLGRERLVWSFAIIPTIPAESVEGE